MNTNIYRHTAKRLLQSCLAASIFCMAFSGVATAADKTIATSIVVRFGDLNLSNPEGAAVLYQRIQRAARRACKDPWASDYSLPSTRTRKCIDDAVDIAVNTVNRTTLTAMHKEKSTRRYG